MRGKNFLSLSVAVLLTFLFLAGCTNTTAARTSAAPVNNQPAILQVTLTRLEDTKVYSAHTSHDAHAIQSLYNAAIALPHAAPGMYNCPMDQGFRYRLLFLQENKTTLHTIIASPTGCFIVAIDNQDMRIANDPHDTFWSLFAQAIGVPAQSLFTLPSSLT